MIEFIVASIQILFIFVNIICLVMIANTGLEHMYEMFTYDGVSREYYNLNILGCLLAMLVFYIIFAPCAVIFWVARLFVAEDYF